MYLYFLNLKYTNNNTSNAKIYKYNQSQFYLNSLKLVKHFLT